MRGLVTILLGSWALLAAGASLAAEKTGAIKGPASQPAALPAAKAAPAPQRPAPQRPAPQRPAPQRPALTSGHTGLVDLRNLARPAAALAGKTHELVPGGTLRFVVREHLVKGRITLGLGELLLPAGVTAKRTVLAASGPGEPSGTVGVEYRLTLPLSAKPGIYQVKTTGVAPSTKQLGEWSFRFSLRVSPRRPGEPRPL